MEFSNAFRVSKAFRRMTEQATEGWEHMVRDVVADIHVEVVVDTPRDTNRAATGWNPRNGSTPDFTDPGRGLYPEPNPISEVVANIPVGSTQATIANGVHYIGSLEAGSSTQAPNNFVAKSIDKAIDNLENVDLLGK